MWGGGGHFLHINISISPSTLTSAGATSGNMAGHALDNTGLIHQRVYTLPPFNSQIEGARQKYHSFSRLPIQPHSEVTNMDEINKLPIVLDVTSSIESKKFCGKMDYPLRTVD